MEKNKKNLGLAPLSPVFPLFTLAREKAAPRKADSRSPRPPREIQKQGHFEFDNFYNKLASEVRQNYRKSRGKSLGFIGKTFDAL